MSTTKQEKLNLYQKLIEVRKQVLYVPKGEDGYKFKYANSADILGQIRPIMDEMGILLVSNMDSFEMVQPKGMLVTMSYTWVNAEQPTEQLRTTLTFYEDKMTGCQGVGSILTYGERYFLYKSFSVATDADAPEQFYKRHGLTAIAEDEPVQEEPKPAKKLTYEKPFSMCQKAADRFWALVVKYDPIYANDRPELLAEYIYAMQKRMVDRDIFQELPESAKNPEEFIRALDMWRESQEAVKEIEELKKKTA